MATSKVAALEAKIKALRAAARNQPVRAEVAATFRQIAEEVSTATAAMDTGQLNAVRDHLNAAADAIEQS